jgi:hypothetical protein
MVSLYKAGVLTLTDLTNLYKIVDSKKENKEANK